MSQYSDDHPMSQGSLSHPILIRGLSEGCNSSSTVLYHVAYYFHSGGMIDVLSCIDIHSNMIACSYTSSLTPLFYFQYVAANLQVHIIISNNSTQCSIMNEFINVGLNQRRVCS